MGLVTTVGLSALGIPLALALGVLSGLLTFVEYLGAIVSFIPAALLALTKEPVDVLWVGLVYLGAHVVEGYFLTPLLTRSMVRLPPAFTLSAQLFMGALYGVVGLTFATPTAIIVMVALRMLYVEDALGDREAASSVHGGGITSPRLTNPR